MNTILHTLPTGEMKTGVPEMNARRVIRTLGPCLLVAGICIGTAALADNLPTISIEASVVSKKVIGMSSSGVPTEEVTVTRRVSYSDLDLKTYSGAQALEQRVKEAAKLACEQIDKLYPLEESDAPNCIRQSVAGAERQVKEAVAAAQGNGGLQR